MEGLGANNRKDSDPRQKGSMVRSRVAEIERGAPGNQQAVYPAISGNNLDGYPIGDGGDARRRQAALRERKLKQGPHSDGFGSRVSKGLDGGWQTPEKLQSLSKSKPIRTLDSIKRKKSKRGNKSKRRRKKTKGRRNKKKKQTKRRKNKGKRKKQTKKR